MRGGAREGAGRPKLPVYLKKKEVSICLPAWLLDWMSLKKLSRAELIETAMRRHHKISPPDE